MKYKYVFIAHLCYINSKMKEALAVSQVDSLMYFLCYIQDKLSAQI